MRGVKPIARRLWRGNLLVSLFAGLLFLIKILARKPVYTGDEPRYLHMAYSFFKTGSFHLAYTEWVAFCDRFYIRVYPPELLSSVHSPVHSILISPFVGLWGPEGGRWAQFAVALAGFFALAKLLQRFSTPVLSVLISFFIFTTLPVFSYASLLYSEIWLMTLLSIALYISTQKSLPLFSLYLGLSASLILPFFHIRTALISAVLVIYLVLRVMSELKEHPNYRRIILCSVLYAMIALAGFVWFQISWSGSVFGSAKAPFEPGFTMFFQRLAIQLWTMRHGLLIFNPALILGIIGLVIGVINKSTQARLGLVLLGVYSLTFVWGAASDSFPARFWVVVLPVFAMGLAIWLII